jgi:hypothetical protein
METLIIESEGKTLEKIKTFLQEINVSFKTKTKKEEKPYNPEFVKTMDKSILQAQQGKLTTISLDEIWK